MWMHPTGQWEQASLRPKNSLAKASPETASAFSKRAACRFLVGSPPNRLKGRMFSAVPRSWYFFMTGDFTAAS